jgi:hypothetical protein
LVKSIKKTTPSVKDAIEWLSISKMPDVELVDIQMLKQEDVYNYNIY